MLERARLRVREAGRASVVEDADTGVFQGTARPVMLPPWWLPVRTAREVREAGDAPLVFTIRRAWSLLPRLEVHDAEGRLVGSLVGRVVSDRNGCQVATAGADGAFRSPDGSVLARVARARADVEISFAEETATDPFLRMLLLAAVLRG